MGTNYYDSLNHTCCLDITVLSIDDDRGLHVPSSLCFACVLSLANTELQSLTIEPLCSYLDIILFIDA